MLLNRSIKTLPPSRRHNSATIRLTDMIEWLGKRPPSEAITAAISHLTEARRVLLGAWPEFADLKVRDPEATLPPPKPAPQPAKRSAPDMPRSGGRFARKEPTA